MEKRATYDDLLKLPDHVVGEIGPSGTSPGPGGWVILDEPELHLGGDVLVPDLAGWRRERMPRMPNTNAFELSPDWVCEIASPSTERFDRIKKMAVYARVGVAHRWIVKPLDRTVENYVLDGGQWKLIQGIDGTEQPRARIVPFDAVELDLGRWWPEEDPAT